MVIAGLWLSVIQYKDDIVSTAVPFCTSFGPTSTCSQSALVHRIHGMFNHLRYICPSKAYVFLPFELFEVAGDYANPTVIVDQQPLTLKIPTVQHPPSRALAPALQGC